MTAGDRGGCRTRRPPGGAWLPASGSAGSAGREAGVADQTWQSFLMPEDPRHRAGKTTKISHVDHHRVQPVSLKLCPRIQGRPEPPLPTVHRYPAAMAPPEGSTPARHQARLPRRPGPPAQGRRRHRAPAHRTRRAAHADRLRPALHPRRGSRLGITRAIPEPGHQTHTETTTTAPKCSTNPACTIRVLLNYRQKPQLALLIYLGSLHGPGGRLLCRPVGIASTWRIAKASWRYLAIFRLAGDPVASGVLEPALAWPWA